jgi:hypothetical protein
MKRFFAACLATGLLAACSESATAPAALAPEGTGPQFAAATETTINQTFDVTLNVFVPCANGGAGEWISVSGPLHDLFHETVNANGFHVKTHDQPQGISGFGLVTGDKYQATGVTQFEANFTAAIEQTFVNNFRMIGQGPGNNFSVHDNQHITVNANGDITSSHDNFTTDCK